MNPENIRTVLALAMVLLLCATNAFAYIDPNTTQIVITQTGALLSALAVGISIIAAPLLLFRKALYARASRLSLFKKIFFLCLSIILLIGLSFLVYLLLL